MKNRRALLFSGLLALTAVTLIFVYLANIEKYYSKQYELIPVWSAAKDIPRYAKIDETLLELRRIPKPFVQPLAVKEDELKILIGAMADATIKKGEQITSTKLALAGEGGISPIIPPNYRACTVAVNEISGVGGLIRSGDFVDIVGTFKRTDEKGNAFDLEAVTVFQNVPVLAVGRNYLFDRPATQEKGGLIPTVDRSSSFSNLTVQMTPRECMDLAVAQSVGELTLTLRSYHDRFTGKVTPELRTQRSNKESATGIRERIEITKRPRWLELRGTEGLLVP